MALGIKKNSLSFEILSGVNPKTLLFLDTSEYMEEPTRPLLEVTMPGYNKYTLVNIVHRKVNVLNSNLVGLSHMVQSNELMDLPDGVWTLKYKICPYDLVYFQRSHLRTTQLECGLREAFHAADLCNCSPNDNDSIKKELVDIMLFIEGGKSEADLNNPSRAADYYSKASKNLNNLISKLNAKC